MTRLDRAAVAVIRNRNAIQAAGNVRNVRPPRALVMRAQRGITIPGFPRALARSLQRWERS